MPRFKPSLPPALPASSPPSSEPSDDAEKADTIVSACLALIGEGLESLGETKLDPPDLVHVANVARAVSAIRARPKVKEDMDYDALLERAKEFPDLVAALTGKDVD